MNPIAHCLTYGITMLSIFLAVVQPCGADPCDWIAMHGTESRVELDMRAQIERYLRENVGFQLKGGGEAEVVVEGWQISPMKVTSSNRASLDRFLKRYAGEGSKLLDRYFVVRREGKLVSVALESSYKDWGVTSYANILVTDRAAPAFANAEIPGVGLDIPFNHSVLPLFQSYHSDRVYMHHYQGIRIAHYPVPHVGQEDQFDNRPYIQFGKAYSGPNLIGNPYSARLLGEVAKHLRTHPEKKSVLVLGSGIGYEAVHVLDVCKDCDVDVSEIDEDALENTRLNIRARKLGGRSQAYLSDLFATIPSRYDLIVFAPPRIVTQAFLDRTKPARINAHEWDAHVQKIKTDLGQYDYEGRLLQRTLSGYRNFLYPGGSLLIMSDDAELPRLAAAQNRVRLLFQGGIWGGEEQMSEGRFGVFQVQPRSALIP